MWSERYYQFNSCFLTYIASFDNGLKVFKSALNNRLLCLIKVLCWSHWAQSDDLPRVWSFMDRLNGKWRLHVRVCAFVCSSMCICISYCVFVFVYVFRLVCMFFVVGGFVHIEEAASDYNLILLFLLLLLLVLVIFS